MPPVIPFEQALHKLEAYCAYQERCYQEVKKKIQSWNFGSTDSNALIDSLIDNGFLNEERFTYAYVSGKFRINKWGRWKIYAHLQQKQIGKELSKKAVSDIPEEDYMDTMLELIARKLSTMKESDEGKREKIFRYLMAKGFELEWIQRAWNTHESKNHQS
jgi:regulatory protein